MPSALSLQHPNSYSRDAHKIRNDAHKIHNVLKRLGKLQLLSSLLCPRDPREAFTAEEAG